MRTTGIAVVGAGPAGIAAALVAAEAGARVTLIDEQPAVGGQLRWRVAPIGGLDRDLADLPGVRLAGVLAERLDSAGVEVVTGGVAWGLFEGNVLAVATDDASYQLQADAVILATGSTDRVTPFPGWTLPGVMTARAALIFLHLHRVLPGERIVVVGDGPEADEVAEALALAGLEPAGRFPSVKGLRVAGDGGVERVETDEESVAADAVVLALGRQPDPELALQARVEVGHASGGHVPLRDASLMTSVAGLYVAGDAAGTVDVAEAMAEGRLAGLCAAGAPAAAIDQARERLAATRGPARSAEVERLRLGAEAATVAPSGDPATRVPTGAQVCVCRCEEVMAEAIWQAIDEGALTRNDVKRRTRAGMGICQGIYCLGTVAAMIEARGGVPRDDLAPMTARPPARAIPLAALAALKE